MFSLPTTYFFTNTKQNHNVYKIFNEVLASRKKNNIAESIEKNKIN